MRVNPLIDTGYFVHWDKELIETVRNYPILYDLAHKDYKNIRKKDKIWDELGQELGEKGDDIKKKWKNLRDTYAKYIRSTKTKTGQAASKAKKWVWADQMEAFRPFLQFAKTASNVHDTNDIDDTDSINHENCEYNFSSLQLQETQTTISTGTPTTNSVVPQVTPVLRTPLKPTVNRKRHCEPPSSVSEMIRYFETKKRMKCDATEQIFLAYAQTIKSFSARRQIETKMKIAQLIMEQELLELEETSNHQSTSDNTNNAYTNISSADVSVSSVGSATGYSAASSPQTEQPQYYQSSSGNTYSVLSNQTFDNGLGSATESLLTNFVTTFNS